MPEMFRLCWMSGQDVCAKEVQHRDKSSAAISVQAALILEKDPPNLNTNLKTGNFYTYL